MKKLSEEVAQRLGKLVANSTDVSTWEHNQKLASDLVFLYGQHGAVLKEARSGSVHFLVLLRTEADRDTFIRACTDGTLARGLTDLLITPDLEQEAGVKLCVRVKIKETQSSGQVPDMGELI